MFCFLSSCAAINHNWDEASWKDYLMEKERLLEIAPTFLEVYEANKKDRSKITYDKKYY